MCPPIRSDDTPASPVATRRLRADDPLDLVNKLYQRSVLPHAKQASAATLSGHPLVVEVDPTSYCDLACPECVSLPYLHRGQFSTSRLVGIAKELVDLKVRAVIVIGGGEPLLHSGIDSFITTLSSGGVAVGVVTNGTQITRHLDVLANHTSWTRVSVDAATPSGYLRWRPARSARSLFPTVIDGIRRLAEVKRGKLGYSFLALTRTPHDDSRTHHNFAEIARAARLARDLGCDYFELKCAYSFSHYLVSLPADLRGHLARQLEQAMEMVDRNFAVIVASNVSDILDNAPPVQPKDYDFCPISRLRTLITPQGVFICPYHRGHPAARLGDPMRQTLREIWSGPERKAAVARLRPSAYCGFHCIRHDSNRAILGGLVDEPIPDYDPFL